MFVTGLRALFPDGDWEVVHLNYTNVAVFPLVWLVRRWQRWRKPGTASCQENRVPAGWLNGLLQALFVRSGLMRGIRFPSGVSLLFASRKRVSR